MNAKAFLRLQKCRIGNLLKLGCGLTGNLFRLSVYSFFATFLLSGTKVLWTSGYTMATLQINPSGSHTLYTTVKTKLLIVHIFNVWCITLVTHDLGVLCKMGLRVVVEIRILMLSDSVFFILVHGHCLIWLVLCGCIVWRIFRDSVTQSI